MDIAALQSLNSQLLWAAFGLSCLFGFIVQRTHFCTMGAVSDIVSMGDWTRMRVWGLAIGVAMLGFAGLTASGLLQADKVLYASNRFIWLSALVGGIMFGFGMVMASGCGSKTLVRIGSGNLKSLVVFVVMGVASFATLKGITAVLRVSTVDRVAIELAQPATLGQWLGSAVGLDPSISALALGLLLGLGLMVWALTGRDFANTNNLLAGIGIGAIITAMWWLSGHMGFVAEHPETLEAVFLATNSGRAESLSFVAPVAYTLDWLIFFSDKSKVITIGFMSVVGMVAGSALQAVASQTFRWEGFGGTEDTANHLVGAVLMGVGGVVAMGCTVGQGLSGISTLSLTSFVALAAILAGAVGGLKYQMWRLERSL